MSDIHTSKIIGPFKQIIPMTGLNDKGPIKDQNLSIVKNGGIWINDGLINKIGEFDTLIKEAQQTDHHVKIEETESDLVALPGLIDAHTHICFAGSRAKDHAARNDGKSYLDIAKSGGGIWSTVGATRSCSQDELQDLTLSRIDSLIKQGITTAEVKSGYGLDTESEIKILRAINEASQQTPINIIPTCLAAHIKPKDFDGDAAQYLDYILSDLVPKIKEENLCNRFDIFIEDTAFTPQLSSSYLHSLQQKGFDLTVHGDQFTTGGSKVAVEIGALSVDHLEVSGSEEIDLIAKSSTIAIALPGASLGLGVSFTPARKLLDAGASLAIASDWNPGSAPMGQLVTEASILANYEKLSAAEVWAGLTFRAASALNLTNVGLLKEDYQADICAYPTNDFREILYHQGSLNVAKTWKSGQLIFSADAL